jgi:predicted aldo/keto reductase-like oxidoreductase
MKPASIVTIRKELKHKTADELKVLCLRLASYKVENKELLTYLLFDQEDEANYTEQVKAFIDNGFSDISTNNYYYIKKSVRKLLKLTKKYIKYSKQKNTEVELLLYFSKKLKQFKPSIYKNTALLNIQNRNIEFVSKKISALHEDLQYDYNLLLEELT